MSRAIRGTLAAAAAAACCAALPAAGEAAPRYVGLGDSYAAGPVIPFYEQPWGCLKSTNNYAHIVQRRIKFAEFRDVSCSGGETEDMTAPQGVSPGPNPPQFDALTADTALVTIMIGGNDIGFSSIAEDCLSTSPNAGSPCRDRYVQNGHDEIDDRIAETGPKVGAVLAGIRARSPQARILLINYPAIFPHRGTGCWPLLPVSRGDIQWLQSIHLRLNAMLAQQAAAHGVTLIDAYEASRGHDACALPGLRWVEPLVPASPAAPVHPNLIGMLALAGMVEAAAR